MPRVDSRPMKVHPAPESDDLRGLGDQKPRTCASLWLAVILPALMPVLTFRPPCASLWLTASLPDLMPVLIFMIRPPSHRDPFVPSRRRPGLTSCQAQHE